MQVALLRGRGGRGLLPAGTRSHHARLLAAAREHHRLLLLLRRRRGDDSAGVSARAGGGKRPTSWLGGLPSWPSRDDGGRKQEEDEEEVVINDPSMVPINEVLGGGASVRGDGSGSGSGSDDDDDDGQPPPGPLGPLAALVVGLTADELARFRTALHAIDADIVRLIPCPRAALEPGGGGGSGLALEDAVSLVVCPQHEPAPEGTPPVVFLSGMIGPEVAEVVRCYREDPVPPLPSAAFCALVPANRRRMVAELVKSVSADEARVREQRRRRREELGA